MEEDLSYLQPDYDLHTLTVPRLRSILVSHDVSYPSSAKKDALVGILQQEVLPKAKRLLASRAQTKRTSKGITDLSSQESTVNGDEEEESMPPPPPRTPRSRRSKAALKEEAVETGQMVPTPATSRRKTPSARRSTPKHPREEDTEPELPEARPSSRKTRKSIEPTPRLSETPTVKIEEPDLPIKRESLANGEDVFTSDNPFQSGSSPSSESRRVSSTSRNRKSLGTSFDRRKSTSRRRQTTSPSEVIKKDDGITAPSRSTFEFPVTRVQRPAPDTEEETEASEEFTPEAQLELVRERASQGYTGSELIPKRQSVLRRNKKRSTNKIGKYSSWTVLTAVLGSLAAWYRKEKIEVGYCGIGKPQWSLAEYPQIPTWMHENFAPSCELCPQHAYCSENMNVECEMNYLLKSHPLSVNGLIPLPPTCEPDGQKQRRVKAVADRAVEELRQRRAAYECGDETSSVLTSTSPSSQAVAKPSSAKLEIDQEDLKAVVGRSRRKAMTDEEFEELWRNALGDLYERQEVVVTKDG